MAHNASQKAAELAVAMRELWPNGWQPIDDAVVARALDRFVAECMTELTGATDKEQVKAKLCLLLGI